MRLRLIPLSLPLALLVCGAGPALPQEAGVVVDDPFADRPRIRLEDTVPAPEAETETAAASGLPILTSPLPVPRGPLPWPSPTASAEPAVREPLPPAPGTVPPPRGPAPVYGRPRPADPVEALGLIIGDALIRELDAALNGRRGGRFRDEWEWEDRDD